MENNRNLGHTQGVTQPRSHSDSARPYAAEGTDMPFEVLESLVFSISGAKSSTKIALSHTLFNPWCDRVTPSGVTRCDGTIASCVRTSFAWLDEVFPEARHAFLVYGVRDRPAGEVRWANVSTLRQYGARMGATVVSIDLFPVQPSGAVALLLPAGRWQVAPKVVWTSMAVQMLLGGSPSSLVRGETLPSRRLY